MDKIVVSPYLMEDDLYKQKDFREKLNHYNELLYSNKLRSLEFCYGDVPISISRVGNGGYADFPMFYSRPKNSYGLKR